MADFDIELQNLLSNGDQNQIDFTNTCNKILQNQFLVNL